MVRSSINKEHGTRLLLEKTNTYYDVNILSVLQTVRRILYALLGSTRERINLKLNPTLAGKRGYPGSVPFKPVRFRPFLKRVKLNFGTGNRFP